MQRRGFLATVLAAIAARRLPAAEPAPYVWSAGVSVQDYHYVEYRRPVATLSRVAWREIDESYTDVNPVLNDMPWINIPYSGGHTPVT